MSPPLLSREMCSCVRYVVGIRMYVLRNLREHAKGSLQMQNEACFAIVPLNSRCKQCSTIWFWPLFALRQFQIRKLYSHRLHSPVLVVIVLKFSSVFLVQACDVCTCRRTSEHYCKNDTRNRCDYYFHFLLFNSRAQPASSGSSSPLWVLQPSVVSPSHAHIAPNPIIISSAPDFSFLLAALH